MRPNLGKATVNTLGMFPSDPLRQPQISSSSQFWLYFLGVFDLAKGSPHQLPSPLRWQVLEADIQ